MICLYLVHPFQQIDDILPIPHIFTIKARVSTAPAVPTAGGSRQKCSSP